MHQWRKYALHFGIAQCNWPNKDMCLRHINSLKNKYICISVIPDFEFIKIKEMFEEKKLQTKQTEASLRVSRQNVPFKPFKVQT